MCDVSLSMCDAGNVRQRVVVVKGLLAEKRRPRTTVATTDVRTAPSPPLAEVALKLVNPPRRPFEDRRLRQSLRCDRPEKSESERERERDGGNYGKD